MRQEEKAKAYDKALEKIKYVMEHGVSPVLNKEDLQDIFPELAENEDEKIRKSLIELVKYAKDGGLQLLDKPFNDVPMDTMITWLEKQGENKSFDYENATIVQKDFAPKEKPMFKVGDWVVHDMSDGRKAIGQIINMTNKSYILDGEDFNTFYFNDLENDYHLWTIQDAMSGDVLYNPEHNYILIYKRQRRINDFVSSCRLALNTNTFYSCTEFEWDDLIWHPATKEQRDTLFAKMREAGYEWSEQTHELKKITQTKEEGEK